MNKLHSVYIIDDEQIDTLIAQIYLKQEMPAVEVSAFSSAIAALGQIERMLEEGKKLPELILLDINMPLVNGWQFLDAFQTLTGNSLQKSIIYLLSSSAHFLDKDRAKTYKVVEDLICKPFTAHLLQRIKQKHF